MVDDFSIWEKRLLIAIARTNNYSPKAHNSKEEIWKRIPSPVREHNLTSKFIKRAYKDLKSKQVIFLHPTRGGKTWNITKTGIQLAREWEKEMIPS